MWESCERPLASRRLAYNRFSHDCPIETSARSRELSEALRSAVLCTASCYRQARTRISRDITNCAAKVPCTPIECRLKRAPALCRALEQLCEQRSLTTSRGPVLLLGGLDARTWNDGMGQVNVMWMGRGDETRLIILSL